MFERETIHDRIADLRKDRGITQKRLCEIADITTTQLSRIEGGITETVSSDVLIKLAKALGVSVDYILGLTDISTPKNIDICKLGLSEKAVKAIAEGKADVNVLNALLENPKFHELLRLISAYFKDIIKAGMTARNDLIDFATSSLGDFIKENPDKKGEMQKDIRLMKSSKLGEHEAEIEKLKSIFVVILRELKRGLDEAINAKPSVNVEILHELFAQARKKKPKNIREMSEITANAVQQTTNLSDERMEEFKQLSERIMVECGRTSV